MHKNVFRILYMFSHPHFADSISHFIRCPFSHFRIFALRILYVPHGRRVAKYCLALVVGWVSGVSNTPTRY